MDERLRDGVVIRPSPFSMVVAMITLLFGAGGVAPLLVAVGDSSGMTAGGYATLLSFSVLALAILYAVVWSYRVVIGDVMLSDGRPLLRPRHEIRRELVRSVRWKLVKNSPVALLLDAEGTVLMDLEFSIARHQAKKIAAMLGVPFEG